MLKSFRTIFEELLSIYDKSETASISDKEIKLLVEKSISEKQNESNEEIL